MTSTFDGSDAALEADFEAAASHAASSKTSVSYEHKLRMYALYKIAKEGTALPPRPGMFDMMGRAKWDSWNKLAQQDTFQGAEGRQEAKRQYITAAQKVGFVPTQQPEEGTVDDAGVEEQDEEDVEEQESGKGMVSVSVMKGDDSPSQGATPLHELAISGDAAKLKEYLASHPQGLDEADENGYTALHLACDRGNVEVVECLLEAGANAALRDADGLTPLELAEEVGHDKIVALFAAKR